MTRTLWITLFLLIGAGAASRAAEHRDEKVYRAVEANRDGALELWRQLVDIDSGTGDLQGGNRIQALLTDRLRGLGADVRAEAAETAGLPDNLIATFHRRGETKILIIAHMDTVFGPGTAAARSFRVEGNRALGPGVGDEKAGVVNAVTALKVLRDLGFTAFNTITLLIDDSEERGSPGSTRLIKALARQHDVEFNMEPGDPPDAITVWRKGSATIRVKVQGRAAHAGMAPQDGRNAATELVHQLSVIDALFPHSGDGITVNLTVITAGDRNNIIPDRAEALLNVRYRHAEEFDQILSKIGEVAKDTVVPDTRVDVSHDPAFPPLTENAQIDALATRAQSIYAELGRQLSLGGNGGASESALSMAEGTPSLDGLGFVGGDFHTDKEWVDLSTVTPRLYLFTRLLIETSLHQR